MNRPAMAGCHEPCTIAADFVAIRAPIQRVWQVLTDFPAYGEWNPLCHAITVDPVEGGAVRMQIHDDSLGQLVSLDYRLSALEENRLLAWTGFFPDIGLVARRDQYVQSLDDSRTIYWTLDIYTGDNARQSAGTNGPWVRKAFNEMAAALQHRAEAVR